ncbi:MAG: TatD family hydrolase [Chloroflexi bacterium]|nr:TatD family hydrolase [Chloroflexota bacterium]
MLVDSHAHLDRFDDELGDALARARERGVERFLTLGTSLDNSHNAVRQALQHLGLFAGVGLHPWWLRDAPDDETLQALADLARANPAKVIAVGEIGLDYQERFVAHKENQITCFRQMMALARQLKLPVSMHSRLANDDLVDLVRQERGADVGGALHGYGGDERQARAVIDMGFCIGVGKAILQPDNEELRQVIAQLPLDHLVTETDSSKALPDQPERGPWETRDVAVGLAQLKGISVEECEAVTRANFERVFGSARS